MRNITINFGKVLSGQRATEAFRISNRTGGAVMLRAIPDCGCIQIHLNKPALRNGQSTSATLSFNTAARDGAVGPAATGFVLRNALSHQAIATGTVLAHLLPAVSLSKTILRWSLVPGRSSGARNVELKNRLNIPVVMTWRGPRRRSERTFEISPDTVRIPGGGKAKISVKLTRLTRQSLYLSRFVALRLRAAHRPRDGAAIKPWKLQLEIRAMPNIPFVAVPGSVILTASDFRHGVAFRTIHVSEAAGSDATILSVKPTDPHLSVKMLRKGVYRLSVREPRNAMIGRLRITYKWGPRKAAMGVGVFVYK
ncbi:MAG: DUF1573 domain-containing protein [Phycisphaerae bacterium]